MTRTKASPRTAGATTAAVSTAPSFLVYPVPSIADESFLQLIFRNKVKRSLFFGFGRSRMAITELLSAEVAQEVEAALKQNDDDAAAEGVAQPRVSARRVSKKVAGEEEKQQMQQHETEGDADEAEKLESMTLADMFAAPPEDAENSHDLTTDATTAHAEAAKAGAAALSSASGFSHLPFLAFRGRPVHVVVSGVRVSDFYTGGGSVPEKHEFKEDRSSSKKKSKKEFAAGEKRAREAATTAEDGEGSGTASQTPPSASAVSKATFPKNACQKCGSPDHFTRHCDGSGAPTATATATDAPTSLVSDEATRVSASTPMRSAPVAAPAAAAAPVRFPKECCQKCGSSSHFTRHCDGSGPTTTATTPEVAITAKQEATHVADVAPRSAPKQQQQHEAVVAVVRPKPAVMQRTSKDQCKFCGSDAHLSRHCPNK